MASPGIGGTPEFFTSGVIGTFNRLTSDEVLPETHVYWDDPTADSWLSEYSIDDGET